MQFISIGRGCNVKYQINRHCKNSETLFFDWLGTDMDTVISVLQCKNINDILTYDNIIRDPKTNLGSRVLIKSLPYCVSIHDFKLDFSDKEIYNFLNKYKRRYERIIEIIKSNKKLCFIRYGKIEDKNKEEFIETILKINPNANFTLVSINVQQNINNVNKSDYFLEINLTYNQTCDNDWTTSYLDWKSIFETINEMA